MNRIIKKSNKTMKIMRFILLSVGLFLFCGQSIAQNVITASAGSQRSLLRFDFSVRYRETGKAWRNVDTYGWKVDHVVSGRHHNDLHRGAY